MPPAGVRLMPPELPAPIAETSSVEPVTRCEPPHPRLFVQRVRPRPFRLSHLMALVAALAFSRALSPSLMPLIMQPASGWGRREQLAYMTSLAMTVWTPILALIALVGDRSRLRRAGRSYGLSAVFAATS